MNCNIDIGNRITINPKWWKETWKNPLPIDTLITTITSHNSKLAYVKVCELDLDGKSEHECVQGHTEVEYRDVTTLHDSESTHVYLTGLASKNQAIAKLDWVLDDDKNWYIDIYTIDGMTNITDELIWNIVEKYN